MSLLVVCIFVKQKFIHKLKQNAVYTKVEKWSLYKPANYLNVQTLLKLIFRFC